MPPGKIARVCGEPVGPEQLTTDRFSFCRPNGGGGAKRRADAIRTSV
jgi:hypothetical protein